MSPWYRIEGSTRSAAMTGGVEARIADPLWLLARQWQVGEFIGDDAGTPLAAQTRYEVTSVDAVRWNDERGSAPVDASVPLERTVEAAPAPRNGGAALSHATRAAAALVRRLQRLGASKLVAVLISEFPLTSDDPVAFGDRGRAAVSLMQSRCFDALALAAADEARLAKLVDDGGGSAAVLQAVLDWRSSILDRYSTDGASWRADRMEHQFEVTAATAGAPLTLRADGYTGGRLDWHSFEVVGESAKPLSDDEHVVTAMPTPVRYDGMPASRWWEFEDASVRFGDIDAGPTDLARMIVADFATVYGDDWYVIPVELPVGSIARINSVDIVDSFGEVTSSSSIVAGDVRGPLGRSWSMFEMHGDTSVDNDRAPLLFLPPTVMASLHGPSTEVVEFARDEGANLGWAIERQVEGPMGRSVNRRESWLAATPPPPPAAEADKIPAYADQTFSYQVESSAPPFWVPLVPERIDLDRSSIHFRRGRLRSWDYLDFDAAGAQGETLEPHRPLVIREEEIPRGGITVERRWQHARAHDGSMHVWVQRARRQGRGDRSSGLAWDVLTTSDGSDQLAASGPR